MDVSFDHTYGKMTDEEKKKQLFLSQKQLLDTFLERGAITKEQYLVSLNGLEEKMEIGKQLG